MIHFDIDARLTRLRSRMVAEGVDAFIALKSVNTEYLTGFDYIRDNSDPHAVLITADSARFMTDSRYLEVAQSQAAQSTAEDSLWQVDDIGSKIVTKDMHELWDLKQFTKIGLEDSLSYRVFTLIEESAGSTKVIPAKNWVEDIRSVKDAAEIERIKSAQAITDLTFTHLCGFIKAGMTEKEIALEIEYKVRKLGAEGTSFSPIVASGPNGSLPHAVPTDRVIELGDLLTLDFGASYGGYCSDMTRTIFVGGIDEAGESVQPSVEQRKVFDTVLAAQQASLAAIKAGASAKEVDAAGREIIVEAGYGDYFIHGTGHGVGLYIHELPNSSPRSEGKLNADEVMTVEPGIYLPGKFGVRIEDMVVVTDDGSLNITESPKDLMYRR
ncbi:MAG: aminopeptidase P family protein [Coriobacteriia bacterium]|nr:aminopeptidase P family protein [Coriobacteriia bacterium]